MRSASTSMAVLLDDDASSFGDGSGVFNALSDDLLVHATSAPLGSDLMSAEERELLLLVLHDGDEFVPSLSPATTEQEDVVTHSDTTTSTAHASVALQTRERGPARHSGDATSSATQSEEDSAAPAASAAPSQQQAVVKVNPRRNRKRRKHEVDALRVEMRELSAKLAELQQSTVDAKRALALADSSSTSSELVATHVEYPDTLTSRDRANGAQTPGQWIVIKNEARATRARWELQAQTERDAAVAAMRENVHLRALYERKLETLRYLEALYSVQQQQQQQAMMALSSWTGDPLSIPWRQDVAANSAQLSKRARLNPFDPDYAIFASLGRDFDAQYAKVDAILAAAGVADVESNYKREMRPTRGANGIYFLESVHAHVHTRDLFEHDRQHWSVWSRHDLHVRHGLFEIRELTDTTMFRKMVNTIRLANTTEVTLIRRTALKRYIEADRVVLVWDTVLEITGPLSMQLRERGWKLMRPLRSRPLGYSSAGPMHVEQSVVRITPELSSTYAPEDIGAGSVTNEVVMSYRRHMRWLHHLNREIFVAEFGKKLSLGCGASRCHKDIPTCPAASSSSSDCSASDELPSLIVQSDSSGSSSSLPGGPCMATSSWRPACVS